MQVQALTPLRVWQTSLELMMNVGDQLGFAVHIEQADSTMPGFDPHDLRDKHPPIARTSSVIFPEVFSTDWHLKPDEFLADHLPRYQADKWGQWGSYFERLTCPGPGAKMGNPLLHVIECLNQRWGKEAQSIFVFHLSGSFQDKPQPQGNPCLQYIEVLRDGDKLNLLFAYRAHDIFGRALGNYIGLSRLLEFICYHTGFKVGGLIGIAGRAYLSGSKADCAKLLQLSKELPCK